MPTLSDDDVVDFMVVEAMTAKIRGHKVKAQKDAERKQKRASHRELRGKTLADMQVEAGG